MSPKLKTELVRVTYWACANPAHRHKAEATAAGCIAIQEASQGRRKAGSTHQWGADAYANVLAQYRAGKRKADIVRQLGLSYSRVVDIITKAEQLEKRAESADPMDRLSVRTRNLLLYRNLSTLEQVRGAMQAGWLSNLPNMGPARLNELQLWLEAAPSNGCDQAADAVDRWLATGRPTSTSTLSAPAGRNATNDTMASAYSSAAGAMARSGATVHRAPATSEAAR